MNIIKINKFDNYSTNKFLIFSLIGILFRVWISQFGSNMDFASWQANLDIYKEGRSIWDDGMYSYGSPWIYTLYFLDSIKFPILETNSFVQSIPGTFYRFKIVIFLSLIDIFIFFLLYKNYSLKVGLLYLLNPISIILTGHHNAFNNYAISIAFFAMLLYGDLNNKSISKKKFISIILLGLSISIKHILFFLPIWLAFKEKKLVNKLAVCVIPYIIFLISFTPFFAEDINQIIYKIFVYGRSETGPFWKVLLADIFDRHLSFFTLYSILMMILGVLLVDKKNKDSFYLYLIASIVFAPQMYTQYLYIPLIASIIYLNWKYFIYIVLTSLLFLVDGDQLNLQIFSNFFDWDLKSTRITFYPIIFILLIAFIENSIGTKNFKSKFNNLIKFFKNKIKSSIYFKI